MNISKVSFNQETISKLNRSSSLGRKAKFKIKAESVARYVEEHKGRAIATSELIGVSGYIIKTKKDMVAAQQFISHLKGKGFLVVDEKAGLGKNYYSINWDNLHARNIQKDINRRKVALRKKGIQEGDISRIIREEFGQLKNLNNVKPTDKPQEEKKEPTAGDNVRPDHAGINQPEGDSKELETTSDNNEFEEGDQLATLITTSENELSKVNVKKVEERLEKEVVNTENSIYEFKLSISVPAQYGQNEIVKISMQNMTKAQIKEITNQLVDNING